MPELPDVELYRRYFEAHATGREVAAVSVPDTRILDGTTPQALGRRAVGRRFDGTRRRGKHLLARLDDDGWIAFHFGMSGTLEWFEEPAGEPAHTCVLFDFADGSHLAIVSVRMLGRVGVADDAEAFFEDRHLGPDALDPEFGRAAFCKALAGRKGTIKSALTDQSLIAGIGNIYSDEILFQARLHPRATPAALGDPALAELYDSMREVLQTAVECGAGSEQFLDRLPKDYLLPHRAVGERCPRCGGKIAHATIAGRSSYFCPNCQKADG